MIETVKEELCINKIVGSKSFNIVVTGDSIIPDSKPDILNPIRTTGNVCIYKREILDGKIRLDGNIDLYLIYLADSEAGRIRGVNFNLDFSEVLDFPNINSSMTLDEEINIKEIECKVLNGRKVSFKAILEVNINVFSNENEEIIREVSNVKDIQSQNITLKMNSLLRPKCSKSNGKRNNND